MLERQIAQTKGVTEQQLIDTLMAPIKDQMQLRVKYEYITQQQADALLQQMADRVKLAVNATGSVANGGFGGPGFCGGPYGGPSGQTNGSFGGYGRGMMRGYSARF